MAITLDNSAAVFAAMRALNVMRMMQETKVAAEAAAAVRKADTAETTVRAAQSQIKVDVRA
jgi:hypothetical protein